MAKALSLVLAAVLCIPGDFGALKVQGAVGTIVNPMTEVIAEEKETAEHFNLEDEMEYLEEPEDYSWMQKLLEEEAKEMQEEGQPEEQSQEAASLQSGKEESPNEPAADAEFSSLPEDPQSIPSEFVEGGDAAFSSPGESDNIDIAQPPESGISDNGSDMQPPESGGFSDNNDIEPSQESLFSDHEQEALFSAGTDNNPEGNRAVLELEEGDDFITELNFLLYKVKDLATDEQPYTVVIPPGNYEIKGTICLYSNIHLYAEGAVMKKTSDKKQILLRLGNSEVSAGGYDGYRNITIEGGTWDCNYESCANKEEAGGFVCFRMGHATNITIKNATFLNNLKSHFLEFGGVKNALVTGCTFEGYWTPHETSGQECIQIDACMDEIFPRYQPFDGTVCTDIVIENNLFQNVFAGAGSHSMMFDRPYTNITVRNNIFRNVKKRSVWLLNCKDSVVSDNIMENVGSGVTVTSMRGTHAFLAPGQKASSWQNQKWQSVLVTNNQITLAEPCTIAGTLWRSYGIQVAGQKVNRSSHGTPTGDYVIRGVTVSENVIEGPGNGIRIDRAGSCQVTGNKISLSNPGAFTNFGIYLGGSRNTRVTGNTVANAANAGIFVYTTSSYNYGSTGNKLVSNQVKNCASDGILIAAKSNNTVLRSNVCTDNARYGIHVRSSVLDALAYNKAVTNYKTGIYCYVCTVKVQKGNTLQENGGTYALCFYKCRGNVQSLKKLTVKPVKQGVKRVTGTAWGTAWVSVYLQKTNVKLKGAAVTKAGKYSVPIKAQKKKTTLTLKATDKYKNVVIGQAKVV